MNTLEVLRGTAGINKNFINKSEVTSAVSSRKTMGFLLELSGGKLWKTVVEMLITLDRGMNVGA